MRAALPHAVESTWLLMDAVLTDSEQAKGISPLTVRTCYSTAFCRSGIHGNPLVASADYVSSFVTGLLDSGQEGRSKISMYSVARQIGLPASFVELRHEATHGDFPALTVFRRAVERSLDWLWHNYWKNLDQKEGRNPKKRPENWRDGWSEEQRQSGEQGWQKCSEAWRSKPIGVSLHCAPCTENVEG